jgi:hypothetical protein
LLVPAGHFSQYGGQTTKLQETSGNLGTCHRLPEPVDYLVLGLFFAAREQPQELEIV